MAITNHMEDVNKEKAVTEAEETQKETKVENNVSTEATKGTINEEIKEDNKEDDKEVISVNDLNFDDEQDQQEPTQQSKEAPSKFERKKKRNKIFSIVVASILWLLCGIMLLICANNIYQQKINKDEMIGFFNIGNAIMSSPSMEPTIKENDIVLYKKVPVEDIKTGDIVAYTQKTEEGPQLIIHNVVNIENGYLTTQGEKNAVPDKSVPVDNIVGKYIGKIPAMGAVTKAMTQPKVYISILASFITLFILRIVWILLYRKMILNKITKDKESKAAIKYFFDV